MYYCDKPLTGPIHAPMLTYCCYDMRVINTTPTMQNTFKIQSIDDRQVVLTLEEDKLLAAAANKLLDLRKRYHHLTFKIIPHAQIVKSYA